MKSFSIKINNSEPIVVGTEEKSTIDLVFTWGVMNETVKRDSDLIGYATTRIENDDDSKTIRHWNLDDLEEGAEITIKITKTDLLSPPSTEKTITMGKDPGT